tara:strand:+ start:556 stop:897 length:342 start_codon:yes stop_codon:yes gene_type:complete
MKKLFDDAKDKLEPPLLDEATYGSIATEFGMYVSWIEDTTNKSIIGPELIKRIKMFLKKEKKIGRLNDYNDTDIMFINNLAMGFDFEEIRKLRKEQTDDRRWPLMEKHIGLKK